MSRVAILLLAACGSSSSPPPATPKPTTPAPVVDAAPKPAGTPFGRFTAVGPEGYVVTPLTNGLSFDGQGVTIFVVDGAELESMPPGKCQSQLEAFATGVVSGLANMPMKIAVASVVDVPRGCRLAGTTTDGKQTVTVEAQSVDLGGGPAFGLLLRQQADERATAVFDKVLASIALK